MNPRNFPARKLQRQASALERLQHAFTKQHDAFAKSQLAEAITNTKAAMESIVNPRGVRTKKDRSLKARFARA